MAKFILQKKLFGPLFDAAMEQEGLRRPSALPGSDYALKSLKLHPDWCGSPVCVLVCRLHERT